MLVLTRKPGEELVIGDPRKPDGLISVERVKGDRVRIGLTFPTSVAITRRELIAGELGEVKGEGGDQREA